MLQDPKQKDLKIMDLITIPRERLMLLKERERILEGKIKTYKFIMFQFLL